MLVRNHCWRLAAFYKMEFWSYTTNIRILAAIIQIYFMVTVYILINPETNKPFYVGSTSDLIKIRCHAHHCNTSPTTKMSNNGYYKYLVLNYLKSVGKRAVIKALFMCPKDLAPFCESFIYEWLTNQGHLLFNSSNRFHRKNSANK